MAQALARLAGRGGVAVEQLGPALDPEPVRGLRVGLVAHRGVERVDLPPPRRHLLRPRAGGPSCDQHANPVECASGQGRGDARIGLVDRELVVDDALALEEAFGHPDGRMDRDHRQHGDPGDHQPARSGNDVIHGGDGDDELDGANGNDSLFGEDGDDTLRGANGSDLLVGGAGDDVLNGANGGDTFVLGPETAPICSRTSPRCRTGSGSRAVSPSPRSASSTSAGASRSAPAAETLALVKGVSAARLNPKSFVSV